MVEVIAFHLMPYSDLPEDLHDKYASTWVNFPNSYFDAKKARNFYHDYLDQLEYCEKLGFDGIGLNEHHQTAYGLMPAPNVMAALLARRTSKLKIAILGNAITLRAYPQQVAEEIAILDVITEGRIISGFVRGIGAEYYNYPVNPMDSKGRFFEAHDLIVKAWTEDGPFPFMGKHYQFSQVNVWPRPYQRPHPPIWLPSQGSKDTIEFAAQKRYTYLQTLSSLKDLKKSFELYREEAQKLGYEASPNQLGWSVMVYVAETDERAWEEAEEHVLYFYDNLLYMPQHYFFPPGYVEEKSMQRILQAKSGLGKPGYFKFKDLVEQGYCIVGSPETVRQKLEEAHKELQFGILSVHMHFGNMPHYRVMKNTELFGRHVLPHVKKLGTTESVKVAL